MDVGFVGLGAMGQLIVRRLMDAGHTVTGWNRSADKGAALIAAGMRWADSPRAVAQASEVVFCIVTDAEAVEAVALGEDGVIKGLRRGSPISSPATPSSRKMRWISEPHVRAPHAPRPARVSTLISLRSRRPCLTSARRASAGTRSQRHTMVSPG